MVPRAVWRHGGYWRRSDSQNPRLRISVWPACPPTQEVVPTGFGVSVRVRPTDRAPHSFDFAGGNQALKRLLIIGLTVTALAAGAASPVSAKSPSSEPRFAPHDLPNPLAEKQAALKASAQADVISGEKKPKGKNKVVKVAKGQYVELAFEGEDQILTLLAEFGSGVATHHGGHPGPAGPLHNQIPQPNRSLDNSTLWAPDFNKAHYENLLYNKNLRPSMANYYLEASSGSYSVNGAVGDWVQVPNNEASYGDNYCGGIVCADTWRFVNDQADIWWDTLVAQQGSVAAANAWLATFDVWDRYDYDGDSNFDEPDGYIDHFQSVHAGEGEETGGGAQGTSAIWSHRWYAYFPGSAPGPDGSGPHGLQGVHIGTSDYWIGDYTVEPENGGVGVFAHEFGHDLNLPDEYDTSGNTGGAENSTGWWTTWSQGSYGTINNEGIGNYPVSMDAWERFQLGFMPNYDVAFAGDRGTYHLGPVEHNTKKSEALFVVLPNKVVTTELGAPFAGANFYYSGSADGLDTTMTRSVTLPAGASLSAKVRYNIEEDFDFAYVMVDGDTVPTNLSNSSVAADGIDGVSAGQPGWVDLTVDLSAFTGAHDITIGYLTDGGVQGQDQSLPAGFAIDNIAISGQPLDGAEADAGWAFATNNPDQGFHVTTGTETFEFFNAYVVESRTYQGYDLALQRGPYNFGFPDRPDFVEHFPLQDGVLIWYWDDSYRNNNVGDHPGEGWILPVDSHPQIETWANGTQMRPRIQSYDATFTKKKTDAITLHDPATGVAKTITSKPGVTVFNDGLRDSDGTSIYWTPSHPSDAPGNTRYQSEWNSVNVPNTGTVIRVKSISSTGMAVIELNK
jgi:immune inhibitor A